LVDIEDKVFRRRQAWTKRILPSQQASVVSPSPSLPIFLSPCHSPLMPSHSPLIQHLPGQQKELIIGERKG